MLNPSNIKGKSFSTMKNGFDIDEVKSFLQEVADDYARILKTNEENEAKIVTLVDKINEYREDEDAIKMALLTSQKEANRILADAKDKAKNMVENAKTEQVRLAEQSAAECERIVSEHKEKCAQLIKENTEVTDKKIRAVRNAYDDEKAKLDELKAEVTYFKATLTELYNKQIKLIMELPTLTDEQLARYEEGYYIDDEEYAEDEAEGEALEEDLEAAEPEQEASQTEETDEVGGNRMNEALNTGSFDSVIPKKNLNDLKFGNNN